MGVSGPSLAVSSRWRLSVVLFSRRPRPALISYGSRRARVRHVLEALRESKSRAHGSVRTRPRLYTHVQWQ